MHVFTPFFTKCERGLLLQSSGNLSGHLWSATFGKQQGKTSRKNLNFPGL